jgi:hypothetical protein
MKTLKLIILFLTFTLTACGGGTVGTGDRSFEGSIRNIDNAPLKDIKVIIPDTGDFDVSDNLGNFLIVTPENVLPKELRLETNELNLRVPLKINSEEMKTQIDIKVDTVKKQTTIKEFGARVAVVGRCGVYFENSQPIRQGNKVPEGTTCILKVIAYGDGERIGDVPISLEYRSCEPNIDSTWKSLAFGLTANGVHKGVAQIEFNFEDSPEKCQYRVRVPYNYSKYEPIDFFINTFTFQENN